MKKGQVVKSLSGHDKGIYHVIIGFHGDYALIADGRCRKAEKPKRKNIRHLFPEDEFVPPDTLTNKRIRNVLHKYNFSINPLIKSN